jgi:hypothetical protein
MLIGDLFIKESIVKPFSHLIYGQVMKLKATKQEFPILDSGELNRRAVLNLSDWRISTENFIVLLFS